MARQGTQDLRSASFHATSFKSDTSSFNAGPPRRGATQPNLRADGEGESGSSRETSFSAVARRLLATRGESSPDGSFQAGRAASHTAEHFTTDFLARLSVAEQRDEASLASAQQCSAEALDALMLEASVEDDFHDSSSFGRQKRKAGVVHPTHEQINRVAELFWRNPAQHRVNLATSSLKVAPAWRPYHYSAPPALVPARP